MRNFDKAIKIDNHLKNLFNQNQPLIFAKSIHKMLQQNLYSFVSSLAKQGLKHVVLCPGSRNAPIILAFVKHKEINLVSIADERSAAFIALGMAKALNEPVAVCCTSGTAVLNFYPAVCEAYYSGIPLVVITADRPPEMIDQWDGQAIRQKEIFEKHILFSLETSDADELQLQQFADLANQAYQIANSKSKGPVHINVPLREPLYHGIDEMVDEYPSSNWVLKSEEIKYPFITKYAEITAKEACDAIEDGMRVLVVEGADSGINLTEFNDLTILPDIICGLPKAQNMLWGYEKALLAVEKDIVESLKPGILVTTGKWNLSKNLKTFIRQHKPKLHIHIDHNGQCADPFNTSPKVLKTSIFTFLKLINASSNYSYHELWKSVVKSANTKSEKANLSLNWAEIAAFKEALNSQPDSTIFHFSNSMPIRYASIFSDLIDSESIHSNRGTSGIDGCSSTALGHALTTKKQVVLFTGDISFFYDSNAWWNNHLPNNLKIILFNNQSGNIFNIIDGASKMTERNPFMTTPHQRSAKNICEDAGINYLLADGFESLQTNLLKLNQSNTISLLEIKTNTTTDTQAFKSYINLLKHHP